MVGMVLLFIGGGLGAPGSLTLEGMEALKKCDIVYVDRYTSIWSDEMIKFVKDAAMKVVYADRQSLENNAHKLITEAREKVVGLLVPGDPFIATTHTMLREIAARKGVEVKILHGVSVLSAAISLSGLHVYKFGKTATIPKTEEIELYTQPVLTLEENLSRGLHTLFLLDTADGGLHVKEALEKLRQAAQRLKKNVIVDDMLLIVLARIGFKDAFVTAGLLKEIVNEKLPPPPHCLIIPSTLHFSEKEIVKTYINNLEKLELAKTINPLIDRVKGYIFKCRRVLETVAQKESLKEYFNYITNYVDDAERFMQSGDLSNALLSIGYAEGLLDALRLMGEVHFKW